MCFFQIVYAILWMSGPLLYLLLCQTLYMGIVMILLLSCTRVITYNPFALGYSLSHNLLCWSDSADPKSQFVKVL